MKTPFLTALALAGALLFSAANAEARNLRIAGELTGAATFDPPALAEGIIDYDLEVTGTVTNLGEVEIEIFGAIDVDAMLDVAPIPPTLFIAHVEEGHAIYGLIRWQTSPTDDGTYTLTGTYQVLGGTGPFERAKGSGRGTGVIEPLTMEITFTISGTVSAPQQPKKAKTPKKVKAPKTPKVPKEPKGPKN